MARSPRNAAQERAERPPPQIVAASLPRACAFTFAPCFTSNFTESRSLLAAAAMSAAVDWEQGKRLPRGPARALLTVIAHAPETAFAALEGRRA